MPSYLSYKKMVAVVDAADDDIESWITVRGNHIPIMKGQSKEEAVKNFIAKKSDKESSARSNKPESVGKAAQKVVSQVSNNRETYKEYKKQESGGWTKKDEELWEQAEKNVGGYGDTDPSGTYFPTDFMSPSELGEWKENREKKIQAEYERLKAEKSTFKPILSEKEDPTFKQRTEILEKMKGVERGSEEYKRLSKEYMSLFPKKEPHIERKRSALNELVGAAMEPERARSNYMTKSKPESASIEETEKAIENFFSENYEKVEAKSIKKEYNALKKQVSNIESVLKENRRRQKAIPAGAATFSVLNELRREEDGLIKKLRKAQQELDDFVHYEMV